MSNGIRFMRPEKFGNERPDLHLGVSVPVLLDAMSVSDKAELIQMAAEDSALISTACHAVASKAGKASVPFKGDAYFSDRTITQLRETLVPLLGDAVAEELKAAIETAEKFKRAHQILESLAHIRQMQREAEGFDQRRSRGEQWEAEWLYVEQMFPQYALKKSAPGKDER